MRGVGGEGAQLNAPAFRCFDFMRMYPSSHTHTHTLSIHIRHTHTHTKHTHYAHTVSTHIYHTNHINPSARPLSCTSFIVHASLYRLNAHPALHIFQHTTSGENKESPVRIFIQVYEDNEGKNLVNMYAMKANGQSNWEDSSRETAARVNACVRLVCVLSVCVRVLSVYVCLVCA